MTHAKHGLRRTGLAFLLVLGLMMIGAAGAQAEGEFLIENKTFAEHGLGTMLEVGTAESFVATQIGGGALYVPGMLIEITCTTIALTEAKAYGKVAHVTTLFSGCKVFTIKISGHAVTLGEELKKCIIHHITTKAKVLPTLHKTGGDFKLYVLFSPLTGTEFGTVDTLPGLGCVLSPSVPITGSIVGEPIQSDVVAQHVTFNGPIQLLFQEVGLTGDKLFFGAQQAFINGLVEVKLAGALIGKKWGAR